MDDMPIAAHIFDWPDRLVVGTVGEPGQRTFFLQARAGQRVVSVAMEKEQAAVLADKIDEVLDQLMGEDGNPFSIPAQAPDELDDPDPLDSPITEQFRVGTIGLGFDPTTAQVVIEAFAIPEEDDEPQEAIEIRIPVGAARSFCKRTRSIVLAGRPFCPYCLQPIDPEGHVCSDMP